MRTVDGRVLAEPFSEKGTMVSTTASGVRYVGNYDHLLKTTALADGPEGIKTGDSIYCKGVSVRAPWAKSFDLGLGRSAILIPLAEVVIVDTPKDIGIAPVVEHPDE
jgi:hypothetical protein